jgi:hypothetical protein
MRPTVLLAPRDVQPAFGDISVHSSVGGQHNSLALTGPDPPIGVCVIQVRW